MTEHVDSVVIGAGVIGIAVAGQLARAGREVIVLEACDAIGSGISSRNSEIIHAGIYYPKDSLKARLCVAGRDLLYTFCESHGVEFKRSGKLIVATEQAEVATLQTIFEKAKANGVDDLQWLTVKQAQAMEPHVRTAGALFSPSTGIVDSHGLMLALQGDAEENGAVFAFSSPVTGGQVDGCGIVLEVGGETPMRISCDRLVNAAGLHAQSVARKLEGLAPETIPPTFYARGNYFILGMKSPFRHLVYPVPVPGGLGTHSVLDMGGQTKFGPDVEWVDSLVYDVDPNRAERFYSAIRRYWPDLPDGVLQPGYAGIRPKLAGPEGGKWGTDFVVQGPECHAVAGLINLYGIESPGLTSSLAIAKWVADLLSKT
ncbi:MAG: NAD(P)/FAD-dependent oxidoreductase [Alphaproteobacteria bacterium]|nr:NAD(P)/FAD-dependent oxidoreductase [Alphaproteobacteria bacterium]